jgi:hypothetical protein
MAHARSSRAGVVVFPGANFQNAGVTPKRLTWPVEIVGEAGAEKIFAAGEDDGGAAGALFGDLAESGLHRIPGEERA